MGHLDHSVATLRLFGDDLLPEDISQMLGARPTAAHRKGERVFGKVTGSVRIAETGSWRLSAERREPENLESQIFEILGRLSSDVAVWREIGSRYKLDLFCGISWQEAMMGCRLAVRHYWRLESDA